MHSKLAKAHWPLHLTPAGPRSPDITTKEAGPPQYFRAASGGAVMSTTVYVKFMSVDGNAYSKRFEW
ncbi:MAG: hypothetical protein JRN35_08205 [Nitrososphaerota archaeon]|nr:hypothetical protein [Nitrososphaerota archaeon]MDG7029907.1 hypothetical protein [Nitrososphaerota archaeon]